MMSASAFLALVGILTFALLGLLFSPVANFLWGGTMRRESILNTFSERSIELYFGMFSPGDAESSTKLSPRDRLTKLYQTRYGLKRYLGPGLMLLSIAGAGIFWGLFTALAMPFGDSSPSTALPPMPPVAMLAVAGAYMWVVSDLQQRYRASDLGWQQLSAGCLRFIIAVPAAYAFGALAADAAALPIAFLLGAFPTKTIMKFARRAFREQLKIEEAAAGQQSLHTLQGINTPIAERFEDEAITSITQLAYSDVIDLSMRTGYAFSFVVDCSSQALAWLYLEDNLKKVRIHTLRGAQEIGNLVDSLEAEEADAIDVLKKAAAAIGVDETTLGRTLHEIAYDPYTEFLRDIWQTTAADHAEILIHSLLPNPEGSDRDNEIAVLANDGDTTISLDGWSLTNSAGRTFELSGPIAAGERLEFTLVCGQPFLRNDGDEITLLRPDGSEASFAGYAADAVIEGEYVFFEDGD